MAPGCPRVGSGIVYPDFRTDPAILAGGDGIDFSVDSGGNLKDTCLRKVVFRNPGGFGIPGRMTCDGCERQEGRYQYCLRRPPVRLLNPMNGRRRHSSRNNGFVIRVAPALPIAGKVPSLRSFFRRFAISVLLMKAVAKLRSFSSA